MYFRMTFNELVESMPLALSEVKDETVVDL
jgi:hypothetical protein